MAKTKQNTLLASQSSKTNYFVLKNEMLTFIKYKQLLRRENPIKMLL
jgi:hypothetical protein